MNEKVNYAAIYHLVDDTTTKCDDTSKDFAKKIGAVIGNVMGIPHKVLSRKASGDRNRDGLSNDNYYGVLHGARMVETPGVILEHGFHTNTADTKWLLDDKNIDRLAKAEAECIDAYFKKETSDTSASSAPTTAPKAEATTRVKVTISNLNIRSGPGTNHSKTGKFVDPGVYTIIEIQNGTGSKNGWGKLKSGAGWISLDYVTKM